MDEWLGYFAYSCRWSLVHVSHHSSSSSGFNHSSNAVIDSHVETVERNKNKLAAESLMAPSSNIELTGVKTQR